MVVYAEFSQINAELVVCCPVLAVIEQPQYDSFGRAPE